MTTSGSRSTARLGSPSTSQRIPRGSGAHGQIVLGDEVHGGLSVAGQDPPCRRCVQRAPWSITSARALCRFLRALPLPAGPRPSFPYPRVSSSGWTIFLDMLSFIPVGFLIVWARRPPWRPVPATVLAAVLAVVLAGGKPLFHGRHVSVAAVVMEIFGASIGALLASRLARPKRGTPGWVARSASPEHESCQRPNRRTTIDRGFRSREGLRRSTGSHPHAPKCLIETLSRPCG